MSRGRAYHRRQARLAKRRAYFYLVQCWGISDVHWRPSPRMVGLWASTHLCPCSCEMCGNGRRMEGPTRQELLNALKLKEGELGVD